MRSSPRAVRQFEEGASWLGAIPEIVAVVVMVTVLLFVRAQFAAMVAPALLNAWLGYMACCVAARGGTIFLSLSPAMRARLPAGLWVVTGQAITLAFCIGIIASIWILMPPADPLLRMLMIILCMWFIAMVIVLNADTLSVAGALGVIASMAAFVLVYRIPYEGTIAGFLVMEGAALVMIRRAMSRAAAKLQAALAQVQVERDAKTRFIASASHDLQQPLQAAQLYFEHMLGAGEAATRERAIHGIRSAFSSTRALLQSMLDHLRLEANAMPVNMAPVDIAEVLQSVALEYEPSGKAANMRISVRSPAIRANLDEHLLRRTLGNLLTNAFTHSQGSRVLLAARRRGGKLEIWAIDNGTGIAPTDATRIFEDYAQGSQSDTGGFGLGLASAQRMAVLMGGTLNLASTPLRGAAFVLRFPLRA